MSFTSTISGRGKLMNQWITWGTFTNGSTDAGGEISTGLSLVDTCQITVTSHLGSEVPKVTKNSSSSGEITIVTSDGCEGEWLAIGR